MTPVFPCLIRRIEDGWRGELPLRLRNGRSAYVVHLSLEQARFLAVEMLGLATDHSPLHHLAVRIAEGLHAKISHIVIRRIGEGDDDVGALRLVTSPGLHTFQVDTAAGLAMAIHMSIPIFMDGESTPTESEHSHSAHDQMPDLEPQSNILDTEPDDAPGVSAPIPRVLRDLIDGLDLPEGGNADAV